MRGLWTVVMILGLLFSGMLAGVGCMNLGGGRQAISLPFSAPNFALDSLGVAQKNDKAAGAQFQGSGGPAAQADPDTIAGQADQIVQVGGDASLARSTDAQLADKQAAATGRDTGQVDVSGPRTQDRRLTPTVNVGPGGGAAVDVQNDNGRPEATSIGE